MSDFSGGGKVYPPKGGFVGADGSIVKVTDAALQGTNQNQPDNGSGSPLNFPS